MLLRSADRVWASNLGHDHGTEAERGVSQRIFSLKEGVRSFDSSRASDGAKR